MDKKIRLCLEVLSLCTFIVRYDARLHSVVVWMEIFFKTNARKSTFNSLPLEIFLWFTIFSELRGSCYSSACVYNRKTEFATEVSEVDLCLRSYRWKNTESVLCGYMGLCFVL